MTRVLVSDTSVLIDLERGNLIEAVFRLPYEFAVPDVLYDRELKDNNGPELKALGLRIEELDGAGVRRALDYRQTVPQLSFPDALALSLAKTEGYILLSGDQALKGLADSETVECHGVIWVLDQINDETAASMQDLYDGLQAISCHPRCRLPMREVNIRLKRFAAAIGIEVT